MCLELGIDAGDCCCCKLLAAALRAADPPKPLRLASWLRSILLFAKMFDTAVVKLFMLMLPGLPAAAAAAAAVNWLKFMWSLPVLVLPFNLVPSFLVVVVVVVVVDVVVIGLVGA